MRSLFYVLSALAVMGLAYWAYQENYHTQEASRQAARLRQEIGSLHEAMGVLKAEWAYLNRPDRLAELTIINFDRLKLLPLEPSQFGSVASVTYPLPTVPDPLAAPTDKETLP